MSAANSLRTPYDKNVKRKRLWRTAIPPNTKLLGILADYVMKNKKIGEIFYDIADILEMRNIKWKPQAYRKAAKSIEVLNIPIERLAKQDELETIPGVGESIKEKIMEYLKTGKIKEYEKLKKSVPGETLKIMRLPGIGPKRTKLFYKRLGITTIKKLKEATKKGKLKKIPGFKKKIEQNILESIKSNGKGKKRYPLREILPIANRIKKRLEKVKGIKKVDLAGSIRRKLPTIGDIDILACGKNSKIMDIFTEMSEVKRILAKGSTKSMIVLKNGIQVDLRLIKEEGYGAALLYFVGNKPYNIHMREIARKKGMKLSEYGLFKGNRYIAGRTEKEVYKKLGLKYTKPEKRNK